MRDVTLVLGELEMMHVTFAAFGVGGLLFGFLGYRIGRWSGRRTR
jgi:hypothetical protein